MSHVELRSYLMDTEGVAVPVEDWHGGVADSNYIEGAIELSIDGRIVVDRDIWDYVDQLLAYMLTMLETLRSRDRAATYFPDQPVELVFERVRPGWLLISLQIRRTEKPTVVQAHEATFTRALLDAATHFFTEMRRIIPGEHRGYSHELAQIEALRTHHRHQNGHLQDG